MDDRHTPAHAEQRRALAELIEELRREFRSRAAPTKPDEPRVLRWLEALMPTFMAIFGLGGQITFTVIPTITRDEDVPPDWGAAEARTFLSLACMFFTLGFGLSCHGADTGLRGRCAH